MSENSKMALKFRDDNDTSIVILISTNYTIDFVDQTLFKSTS